jgi:hypothetical protein
LCVLDCVYVYKMIGDFLIGKLEKLDIITKWEKFRIALQK